jgi:ribosomal protein S27E
LIIGGKVKVNKQFIKDLTEGVNDTQLNQTLPAGSMGRRYEPECGVGKHNERIHRESRYADEYKNLPFSFRKPFKPKGRSAYVQCNNCGHITLGTSVTVGIICSECKKFSVVTEVEIDR